MQRLKPKNGGSMPVSGRGGFNPRSSRPSQGPSSFLVPSWAWLSRPTSFSPLEKIGCPIWDVGNWKRYDWGWGWRWVGRETPLCVTKKSDGAGGLNMERGKVARSSGEGKPKGETQGENGRPRVQCTHTWEVKAAKLFIREGVSPASQ